MHRALQIPEILAMVFQPFSMIQEGFGKREEDWKLCQTTLNSAARVCRIFSDPALNALWARIYSQDNLFDLISTLKKTDEGQYYLDGCVTDHDWQRFKLYAQRIRCIRADFDGIPPIVLQDLTHRGGGEPLLPRLEELRWYTHRLGEIDITAIFGEHLRELHLSAYFSHQPVDEHGGNPHALYGTFPQYGSRAHNLVDIYLEQVPSVFVSALLPCCAALRRLVVNVPKGVFHDRDLDALSSLEHLEYLSLLVCEVVPTRTSRRILPALTELELGHRPATLIPLIMSINTPALQDLQLFISIHDRRDRVADFTRCLEALSTVDAPFLSSLNLNLVARPSVRRNLSVAFCQDILRPLFDLRTLEHIELHVDDRFRMNHLTREDVHRMAVAWPHLQTLSLELDFRETRYDVMPLDAIAHLAQNCPDLRLLELPSAEVSPDVWRMQFPAPAHGLEILNVAILDGDDVPLPIASYLDRMFPDLDLELCSFGSEDDPVVELPRVLHALQQARAQEHVLQHGSIGHAD
ncbi:hypothetical protein POSPLADRAFT_1173527 [Postia placenta MAD-698-R-SB12]|uniref:F-box domain-containing protein n=1 Tax=Postia placenta MAD-698-R-SB12 TaxID=670580 RepID=A0A1X6MQU0_9APHY|nr:hypothetical protein POSPLADRAFT_1173527 [Postia placenta MAD-698-R-SB12]OSX58670.1 hypothetical protein POSPLADRAFT_1173527 [Postia placenta MAD-698-R-SB12]